MFKIELGKETQEKEWKNISKRVSVGVGVRASNVWVCVGVCILVGVHASMCVSVIESNIAL